MLQIVRNAIQDTPHSLADLVQSPAKPNISVMIAKKPSIYSNVIKKPFSGKQ